MRRDRPEVEGGIGRREWLQRAAVVAGVVAARGTAAQGALRRESTARVAVASSVQPAMEAMLPAFTRATGHAATLTAGASGNLARQIGQGLPVDLFLSADEEFARRLAASGWARDAGVVYATGRLALVVAHGTQIGLDGRLQGLKAAWSQIRRFSIANPLLAPYGVAAREALQSAGLWDAAQPKLVLGENVAQAAQFVASGSAQAGLTALSLLAGRQAPGAAGTAGSAPPWGGHVEVDPAMHAPLRQRMVLSREAPPAAVALYAYLQTPAARALFLQHGFGLP